VLSEYTFLKETNSLASAWMFLNISSNPALNASNGNNYPDQAILMKEKGCSGFVKHVMDVHSIFFLV